LFGVRFKECHKETASKAICYPLLKRFLCVGWANLPSYIAQTHQDALLDTQSNKGVERFQGIVKELFIVIDSRQARAQQQIPPHDFTPHPIHFWDFGKKAMPTHIKVKVLEFFGTSNPSHFISLFQNNRVLTQLDELVGSRKSCRSASNDDNTTRTGFTRFRCRHVSNAPQLERNLANLSRCVRNVTFSL